MSTIIVSARLSKTGSSKKVYDFVGDIHRGYFSVSKKPWRYCSSFYIKNLTMIETAKIHWKTICTLSNGKIIAWPHIYSPRGESQILYYFEAKKPIAQ